MLYQKNRTNILTKSFWETKPERNGVVKQQSKGTVRSKKKSYQEVNLCSNGKYTVPDREKGKKSHHLADRIKMNNKVFFSNTSKCGS